MLNCVYHPIGEMRVVEDDERAQLIASGVWFDRPNEAKKVREEMEKKLKKPKKSKGENP